MPLFISHDRMNQRTMAMMVQMVYKVTFHKIIAAKMRSRGLAYLSTGIHVRCLNFRVRKESGCDTPAVAAIESQDPDLNRSVVDLQSTAWPLRHLGLA